MKLNRPTKVHNHCLFQYLGVLEQEMTVDTLQKRSVVVSALDRARVSTSLTRLSLHKVQAMYLFLLVCRTAVA